MYVLSKLLLSAAFQPLNLSLAARMKTERARLDGKRLASQRNNLDKDPHQAGSLTLFLLLNPKSTRNININNNKNNKLLATGKLFDSHGAELRRTLFSLRQIFQVSRSRLACW